MIPVSVLLENIAPVRSWMRSALRVTAPLDTEKSVESKLATPLLEAVASSADMVTVPELSATSKPSPAAKVIVPPNAVAVELEPSDTVIVEFASLLFAIEPANMVLLTVPLSPEPTNVPAVAGKVTVGLPLNAE